MVVFLYSFLMVRTVLFPSKFLTPRFFLAMGVTAFYGWLYFSQWWLLKVQNNIGGGRNYADLAAVLNAARCYERIGDSVYSTIDTCGFQYGIFLLRFIQFFNLDSVNLVLLGGLLILSAILVLLGIAVYSVKTSRQAIIAFFLVTSPGPWLLFERGNFDLLIIILVAIGTVFINSRLSFLTVFFITLSALMKFYTLPLLILYIIIEKRLYLRVLAASAIVLVTPIILFDISRAPSFPNPTFVAFGLPSPGLWINFFAWRFDVPIKLGGSLLYLIGFLVFFAGVYLMYFSPLRQKFLSEAPTSVAVSTLGRNTFLIFSGLYLSCFLAGMNYDYRLYFLIVSLLLVNLIFPDICKSRLLVIVQISALWATIFFFGITGPIHVFLAMFGNFCQLLLAIYLLGAMYRVLEPSSSLKWTVGLSNKIFRKA
jgi:hypothetical protein